MPNHLKEVPNHLEDPFGPSKVAKSFGGGAKSFGGILEDPKKVPNHLEELPNHLKEFWRIQKVAKSFGGVKNTLQSCQSLDHFSSHNYSETASPDF